jgi:O-antigen ligase
MALPIAAAHGLRRTSWPAWGLLALLSTGVVLSGSRTALVGSTVGVLLLAWRRFWKPVLLLAALQTALVSLALLLPTDHGIGQLAQRLSGGLATKLAPMLRGAGSTASEAIASGRDPYRSELFPQAIQFIQHHPLLGLAEPLLGRPPVEPPALLTHTHNVAFQLSIQHGLPAAVLLVGLVLWLLRRGWQARPQGIDRALLCSAVAAVWLHAYDIPSFDSRNNMLGWLLLSCCWAVGAGGVGAATPPDLDGAQNGPAWGDA